MPGHVRTVCLEFFGSVALAVPAIVEITGLFGRGKASGVLLAGLEHLDERSEGRLLRHQGQPRRTPENGADRRHRQRR